MKYTITAEQRFFFKENGFIEFEDLLNEDQVNRLSQTLAQKDPEERFQLGRNLWMSDESVRRISKKGQFGEFAANLCGAPKVLLAYDQLLPARGLRAYSSQENWSLAEYSCFEGLLCALLLNLDDRSGSGTYIHPDHLINFHSEQFSGDHFLIAFSSDYATYIENRKDPHYHCLKHHGYIYGSRLIEKNNPLIYPA